MPPALGLAKVFREARRISFWQVGASFCYSSAQMIEALGAGVAGIKCAGTIGPPAWLARNG